MKFFVFLKVPLVVKDVILSKQQFIFPICFHFAVENKKLSK